MGKRALGDAPKPQIKLDPRIDVAASHAAPGAGGNRNHARCHDGMTLVAADGDGK